VRSNERAPHAKLVVDGSKIRCCTLSVVRLCLPVLYSIGGSRFAAVIGAISKASKVIRFSYFSFAVPANEIDDG
jgi:hypothetical protein